MNPPSPGSEAGREDLQTLIPLGIILCIFGAVLLWPANMGVDFQAALVGPASFWL